MKVFLDVDALDRLGAFNVLREALDILRVPVSDVWVPGTAKYKLRLKNDADAVKRHGLETATRLRAFIATAQEIVEGPTEEEKRQLSNRSQGWMRASCS